MKVLSVEQILARLERPVPAADGREPDGAGAAADAAGDARLELRAARPRRSARCCGGCAVFAGGWTLEAAEAVCRRRGGRREEERGRIQSLLPPSSCLLPGAGPARRGSSTSRSLVVAEERGEAGATGCWRRSASTRSSAWRRAAKRARRRGGHAEYFLALAEAGRAGAPGARAGGVARAARSGARQPAGGARVVARARRRRLLAPGRGGAQFLGRTRAPDGRAAVAGAALERSATAPALVRAKALRGPASLARQQGDLAAARAYYEESLRIAREAGDSAADRLVELRLGTRGHDARRPARRRARTSKRVWRAAREGNDRLIAAARSTLWARWRAWRATWAEARGSTSKP